MRAAFCAGLCIVACAAHAGEGTREDAALPKLLDIAWRRGPNLPQGFQDSHGGIVGDSLITVGGFCSGIHDVPGKEDRYPRGFLKKVWAIAPGESAWRELPEFPGVARQGLFSVVVDDALYAWGGFNYDAPYCYADGYRLAREGDAWTWTPLPALPAPACSSGACAIGPVIYVTCGADYDGVVGFFTETDRAGEQPRKGARLLTLDTRDLAAGWRELAPCPGTCRFVHAAAAVDGRLYVVGGATGSDNDARQYCTVVDNWTYDPAADRWERLPDTPIATGNFPAGSIVFADRYLLLVGGYQYGLVRDPDGASRPPFGEVARHDPANAMCSDVLVFDAQTRTFGRADPLPLNNNLPLAVLAGDQLQLIGGETGGATIDGEAYGHHPDLYLVGTIRESGEGP